MLHLGLETAEHFDGVAFSFDKGKDALIDALGTCGSFASTHEVVAKLEAFGYFSLKEVGRVLSAAVTNNQVGYIVEDRDVSDFLNRIAVPRSAEIADADQREIILRVVAEQGTRPKQP